MLLVKQIMKGLVIHPTNKLAWRYRRLTWRRRTYPSVIIIGAQKSGTSSLFAYLGQHPMLIPSNVKEVHFFDGGLDPNVDNFEKGTSWYRAHFPPRQQITDDCRSFEASPLYMFNPLASERIHNLLPSVKLIALVRNPTERAISHYFHEKRLGWESLSIEDALRAEEERLELAIRNMEYRSVEYVHHSYKSRGRYAEQLVRYYSRFPRDQILVLRSEDLFGNPASTLEMIYDFVDVDNRFKNADLEPWNVGKNRSDVDASIYEYLDDYFRPHNQKLYDLVGQNMGWESL